MDARLLPSRGLGNEVLSKERGRGEAELAESGGRNSVEKGKRGLSVKEGGGNVAILSKCPAAGNGCQASPIEGSELEALSIEKEGRALVGRVKVAGGNPRLHQNGLGLGEDTRLLLPRGLGMRSSPKE
jgi:hypothetical protein